MPIRAIAPTWGEQVARPPDKIAAQPLGGVAGGVVNMEAAGPLVQELSLRRPLMNAAGTLGYAANPRGPLALENLGAFITNPISYRPRLPAENRVLLQYPGGFLLHTGLPNPGYKAVARLYRSRWAVSPLPVIAHILGTDPFEVESMVRHLEGFEGIYGFELGVGPECSQELALQLIHASIGELPVIPCLLPEQARQWGRKLAQSGFHTISLQAPRGLYPGPDGRLVAGRLYGPALLPGTLAVVREIYSLGLAVIAGGGATRPADLAALRAAGACAVQLDSAIWLGTANDLNGSPG